MENPRVLMSLLPAWWKSISSGKRHFQGWVPKFIRWQLQVSSLLNYTKVWNNSVCEGLTPWLGDMDSGHFYYHTHRDNPAPKYSWDTGVSEVSGSLLLPFITSSLVIPCGLQAWHILVILYIHYSESSTLLPPRLNPGNISWPSTC